MALGLAGVTVALLGLLHYALSVTPEDLFVARFTYVGGLLMAFAGALGSLA